MIGVVVNPNARRNRRRPQRRIDALATVVGDYGVVRATPDVSLLADTVRDMAADGVTTWVADGGDGSLHWLINTCRDVLGEDIIEHACFVATRSGTVNLVAQNAEIRGRGDHVLRRLVERISSGRPVPEARVPALVGRGLRQTASGAVPFERYGFAFALGGYGANFFGPYDRAPHRNPTGHVLELTSRAFAAGLGEVVLRGPAERLRPAFMRRDAAEFLAPLRARVSLDGEPFVDRDGDVVERYTALHVASVPINFAGVFRVFVRAEEAAMHAQGGDIPVSEMVLAMPTLMTGHAVPLRWMSRAFDRPCDVLAVVCLDDARMAPVVDGERYTDVSQIEISAGPSLRVAVP